MSRYITPRYGPWGGAGGFGRGVGGSWGALPGWGGGGRWGRRRRHLYGPVPLWRGLYGRGGAARRRRDRRLRRWFSVEEASHEERRDNERLREEESMRISEEVARRMRTLTVSHLDLHVEDNTQVHHTDDYACTTADPKQLVVRRGQEFMITMTFDRCYDNREDDLFFVFSPDDDDSDTPHAHDAGNDSGPLAEIFSLDEERKDPFPPNHPGWAVRIVQTSGTSMALRVHVAANCVVGEWDLRIRTKLRGREGEGEGDDFDYDVPQSLIVLFNPWSSGDQVYFPENPEHLQEYVLNEEGLVFRRTQTPWFYGQFADNMLAICLSVLRKAFRFRMTKDMGDAVLVARGLSRIVNSQDDDGVLVGNWSGRYSGGVRPTNWHSSLEILRKFYNSGHPVKFGQCWVYSHVLTAVCRALGLPCRSVTNFDSAHDTTSTCTIDYYYARDGDVLENMKTDSVWNFHVWNEVWIMRPDQQGDYDGWHVIDATPQETSRGLYQCGPCPVKAVKRGEVEVGYDTRFVFSEVNADVIHWTMTRGGEFEVSDTKHDEVGTSILTKHPTMDWHLDITSLYKYPEGSPAERAAVQKAIGKGRHGATIYKNLEVWFDKDAGVPVGKDLELTLQVRNLSREVRVVAVSIAARATHYWNHVQGSKLLAKRSYQQTSIRPGKTLSVSVVVAFHQYQTVCDDVWTIRGFASATDVSGGDRTYTAQRTFSLLTPGLTIKGPERARTGQSVTVSVSFTNPLPMALTGCSLHMDGSLQVAPDDPHPWSTQDGTLTMAFRRDSAVRASERVMLTVRLMGKWAATGERRGKKSMVVSFDCDQLGAMKGVYHLMRAS